MTRAPTFDDIFRVMAAAFTGDTSARVALPENPSSDDTATRFAIALNLLLDDLVFRSAQAEAAHKAAEMELERLVTERTRELSVQTAALKTAQEQLRLIIDTAQEAFIAIDARGVIIDWNKEAETILGWSREEVVGRFLAEIVIPHEYRKAHRKGLQHFLATGEGPVLNRRLELSALRRDGTEFPVELTIASIREGDKWFFNAFLHDITERRQYLSSIYETVADVIFVLEIEGDGRYRFASVNPAFSVVTGLSVDQVVGKLVNEIIPEPSLSMVLEKYAIAIRERRPVRWEETSEYPIGRLTGAVSVAPVFDQAGNCTLLVGAVHDITELKRSEKALKESEERLRNTMDSMLEGCQIIGHDWRYLYVNDSAAAHGRTSKENLLGKTMMEAYPGIQETELFGRLKQCMEDRTATRMENAFTFPNGDKGWFELSIQPVPEGLFILSIDITQRKRAEDELQWLNAELEHRVQQRTAELERANSDLEKVIKDLKVAEEVKAHFSALVESSEDAIISRNIHGIITSWNKAAERLYGYTTEEAIGTPLSVLVPPHLRDEFTEFMARVDRGEPISHFETVRQRKDGTLVDVSLSISPVRDTEGNFSSTAAIVRDITEQKRVQDEIKTLNRQLEAANKELEAFAYSVSHDLRAPLRAIDGFSRLLLERYEDRLDAPGQRFLNQVRASAKDMSGLIDDLLEFSRIGRADLHSQEIKTENLAREALKDLEPELGGDVEIRIHELPPCYGDRRLLKQVFVNLLSNAIKYSRKREKALIEVGSCPQNGQTVYFVKDNGVGFDMQYANKLFQVFQRLHSAEEYPGTGIGLALVHRIVSRHNGKVWADAKEGKGATFYFTLEGGESGG